MLIAFWLLLFMYVGLTLLYAVTKIKPPNVPPWPLLEKISNEVETIPPCQVHSDCPPNHVCLGNQCLPKLLRGDDCNLSFGKWVAYVYKGVTFGICVCLYPHHLTQNHFGGNCNINIGCGTHGIYIFKDNKCDCDPGYQAVGFTCKKLPSAEYKNNFPCTPDEIPVEAIHPIDGFHPDYVTSIGFSKCVRKPCSFDALTGRPLKHAKFEPNWGCVCDPKYGLFGVVLEGSNKKYLDTPGYDACSSIFSKDMDEPIDVKLVTYFYLGRHEEPISLILFENLKNEDLVYTFKDLGDSLIIGQSLWKYDAAQYFFKTTPTFRARTREAWTYYIFDIQKENNFKYKDDFKIHNCTEIPTFWKNRQYVRRDAFSLLYQNPVCYVDPYDTIADPQFMDRVIVNPMHLTFQKFTALDRFNAFVLHFDTSLDKWTLDLDYPFQINMYRYIKTNAPVYDVDMQDKKDIPTLMIEGQT